MPEFWSGRRPSAPMPGTRVAAPAHTCMRRQAMFDKEEACDINHVKRISPWRPCRAKRGKRRRSPSSHRKRHRKENTCKQPAASRRTTSRDALRQALVLLCSERPRPADLRGCIRRNSWNPSFPKIKAFCPGNTGALLNSSKPMSPEAQFRVYCAPEKVTFHRPQMARARLR